MRKDILKRNIFQDFSRVKGEKLDLTVRPRVAYV